MEESNNSNSRRSLPEQATDEEKKKQLKKERKKRDSKIKEKKLYEFTTILETVGRIMSKQQDTDDMNLRCYMMLYNITLIMEILRANVLLTGNLPEKAKDIIPEYLKPIEKELKKLMDWVMNERNIIPSDVNPLPIQLVEQ